VKRLLLLLAALSLTACAPVAGLTQGQDRVPLTRDGRDLLIVNPGPGALTGDPTRPGDGPALTMTGSADLTLDATAQTWCTLATSSAPREYRCNLPTIPGGSQLRVVVTAGQVSDAGGLAYRAGKSAWQPVLLWLR
jgi:hypothetical protein